MAAYTKATPGAPTSGFYNAGDSVTDSVGNVFTCMVTGFSGQIDSQWGSTPYVLPVAAQGVGTVSGSGVSVVEQGQGIFHQTTFTLTAVPLALVDANVGGGLKIYQFPKGRVRILGAAASLAFTTTSTLSSTLNASKTINYGLGSVITTTQASGTLTTTESDILPSTNATSSATINVAGAAAVGTKTVTDVQLDGTGTAINLNLNVGVATNTDIDGDATVTVTGTIVVTWASMGTL